MSIFELLQTPHLGECEIWRLIGKIEGSRSASRHPSTFKADPDTLRVLIKAGTTQCGEWLFVAEGQAGHWLMAVQDCKLPNSGCCYLFLTIWLVVILLFGCSRTGMNLAHMFRNVAFHVRTFWSYCYLFQASFTSAWMRLKPLLLCVIIQWIPTATNWLHLLFLFHLFLVSLFYVWLLKRHYSSASLSSVVLVMRWKKWCKKISIL